MSRYTYYHVLYVGMINIIMFVPGFLIKEQFTGAVSSMVLAVVLGSILSLVTMACFERFPGLGFPELCDRYLPRWLSIANSLYAALLIWMPAGVIVIYQYSETLRLYFYPDMNPFMNLFLMASVAVWASSQSTRTVQFIHEIMVILCSPLLILFLVKALFNESLSWDAVHYVAGYVREPPTFMSTTAATFLFSGYISLFIFNRLHPEGFRFRFRWLVPLFGTLFMAVTFFVPIGFHGTVGVGDYVYIWSTTADSMSLEYGFINRVLYVFLLIFTILSLLFVMNTWHTTIQLIRHIVNQSVAVEEQPNPPINRWLALIVGASSFVYMYFVNTERNQSFTKLWLVARFFTEIIFLLFMIYFVMRKRKESKCA
jgi:hypothetical protein